MTAATTLSPTGTDAVHRTGRTAAAHHGHAAKGGASALGFAQALADMLIGSAEEAAALPANTPAVVPDLPTAILPDDHTAQTTVATMPTAPELAPAELLPDLATPAETLPKAAPVAATEVVPIQVEPTPDLANVVQTTAVENQLIAAPQLQPETAEPTASEPSKEEKPNEKSETKDEAPALQAVQPQPAPVAIAVSPLPPANPQVKLAASPEVQLNSASMAPAARPAQVESKPADKDSTNETQAAEDTDVAPAKPEVNRTTPNRQLSTGFEMQSQHRSENQSHEQPKFDKSPDTAPISAQTADVSAPALTDVATESAVPEVQTEPLIVNQPDWEGTLAEQIAAHLSEDGDKLELQLSPDNLGQLTITLEMTDGGAQVTILTETAEAAGLFQQSEHRLSDALQKSGLQLSTQDASQRQLANSDQSGQGNRQPSRGGTDFAFTRQNDRLAPNPNTGRQQASLLNIVA